MVWRMGLCLLLPVGSLLLGLQEVLLLFQMRATIVKWSQRGICPGDSLIFVTYFGICREIAFVIDSIELNADCNGVISPNPADVSAILTNYRPYADDNISSYLEIEYPGISVDSSSNPQHFAHLAAYGGVDTARWLINFDSPPPGICLYTITTTWYSIYHSFGRDSTRTDSFSFEIPSRPRSISVSAVSDPSNICLGSCSQLNAAGIGGLGPLNYRWTPTTALSDSSISNPQACPIISTFYHVTFTDSHGCFAEDSVYVTVLPRISVASYDTIICAGSSIVLHSEVEGGIPPYSYNWSPTSTLSGPRSPNPIANPLDTLTIYTILVTDLLAARLWYCSCNV